MITVGKEPLMPRGMLDPTYYKCMREQQGAVKCSRAAMAREKQRDGA